VGTWQVKILSAGWTAVTRDKQLSAQFEHSIGVTETGVEFFTLSPAGYSKPPYDLSKVTGPEKQAASA
ncbi:MAG: type I methionyl aminopeptidase, partial [Rhodospirillaceae bacterium]